ncbi:hypothetical protein KQH82_03050 [bacterium]|nr:hypothetical protein [bacterium]
MIRSIATNLRTIALGVAVFSVLAVSSVHARSATVTYVSTEGVYFDAGSNDGLAIGDTLDVVRGGVTIASVVINNISSQSAAAVIVSQEQPVAAGDVVVIGEPGEISVPPPPEPTVVEAVEEETRATGPDRRLRGDVAMSLYQHQGMGENDLNWSRPGISMHLWVDEIGDGSISFEMRHRTRLYHRSRSIREGQSSDEWTHRLYEFSLLREGEEVGTEWGAGRIVTPYVRGVGYVDGGYVAQAVGAHYKVGVAAGTTPDRENSGVDFGRRKAGVFVAYETGDYQSDRLTLSTAFSTEYEKSTVSRDYLYLQGTYSSFGRLTTYHSVEIDLNRDWRYASSGDRFTFTNYFGNATITLHRSTRVFLSYDTRRNIRYYETREVPDSLFDETSNRGVRGGVSVRFSQRVSARVSGGVRFRDDLFQNPVTGSVSLRVSRFPLPRHSLSMFFSYVNTEFTTGYRPMVLYRFPLKGRLLANLTGAAHIYETGPSTTKNYYADVATSYYFRSGWYVNGSYRQYFDDELQSAEVFAELGVRW